MIHHAARCLALVGCSLLAAPSLAQTVWTGDEITFTKIAFADPTQAANQDQLTDLVSLTRASTAGLFNAASEGAFARGGSSISPEGTRWATNLLSGNGAETIDATNFANLTFDTWTRAFGGGGEVGNNIVDRQAVVHLVDDDIYLNLRFTQWGAGGGAGGSFTYVRSTPIPEPAAAALGLLATLFAPARRR